MVNLRVAAKAAIVHNNKVLVVREAKTYQEGTNIGKYGLVGGRIEPEESFDDALLREILEETGLKPDIKDPVYVGEWWPTIGDQKNHIVAIFMLCDSLESKIVLSEEHDRYLWIASESELDDIEMVEPDRTVVLKTLSLIKK